MASSSPGPAVGPGPGAGPAPLQGGQHGGPTGGPIGGPIGGLIGGPIGGPAALLRAAATRGELQEVVRLLGEGAKLLPDEAGCTALQRASAEGHLDLVKQLLKHKADVNVQDKGPGNTALHEASWKGYSRCVQALCAVRGANLSLRNHAGFAALHLACQNGHNQSCRELLLAGCDPDVRNNYGDTPLHTSARYGHAGVTRILVSAECKVSEQNKNGDTALHIAAAMGRRKLTRILLEAGCTKSLRNKQGETARDIATRKELTEILSILNNPVIPMPRNKDVVKENNSKNNNNNSSSKKKHKKTKDGRSGRASGSRSGSRSGTGTGVAAATAPGTGWSPYGCHYYPDTTSFPQPRLDSLPAEPLRKGEQYYLDLAGNIRKGPVGVGYTCYCAPFFRHMEQRLDRDKHDLKQHINQAVEGLERRTQGHISQLTRSLAAERARCSQRHLHLQQWLRGVGGAPLGVGAEVSVPRARSVDSLLEHTLDASPIKELVVQDVGEEIEVLSEGDNTARRKESFLRRGGRPGKMPRLRRLRPGINWDVLAEADKVMAATDPTHAQDPHPLLSAARLQARAKDILPDHPELGVLDERVAHWRGQQRRLMLEVARASREIAQLKRVTARDRGRGSSGSELDRHSRNGRDSRGSRGSRGSRSTGAAARRLQTLDQVDEGGRQSPSIDSGPARTSVQYLHAEVHPPPKSSPYLRCRSQELLRVEPVASRSPSPSPSPRAGVSGDPPCLALPANCSPAARSARWHGVSVTAEDIENWRRLDRLRDLEQDAEDNGGMVTNPDYEVQVEDGIIFSSDLSRLPPLPQPQQPTASMRSQQKQQMLVVEPAGPAKALTSAPPPATAVLHPKPKFGTPFHPQGEAVPFPRGTPSSPSKPNAAPVPTKRATASPSGSPATATAHAPHVPLRKSVHDMVARIQTHMLNNLMGRQQREQREQREQRQLSKEEAAVPREMPIDVGGDCVQVQARRVHACQRDDDDDDDSESSDGEDTVQNGIPDYENVACWQERERDRRLVSELPYRSRTAVYSPDVDPDFLDIPLANGHTRALVNGHGLTPVNGHGLTPVNGHGLTPVNGHGLTPVNGHGLGSVNGHGLAVISGHGLAVNGHGLSINGRGLGQEGGAVNLPNGLRGSHPLTLSLNGLGQGMGHLHSPTGTPDLELEVHGHPFHHPYSSGMYSPDHGDSGYSTRLGGSSNSKGTSPSLSGLDGDGVMQNTAPRSAAALNIVHQRHTNASLV